MNGRCKGFFFCVHAHKPVQAIARRALACCCTPALSRPTCLTPLSQTFWKPETVAYMFSTVMLCPLPAARSKSGYISAKKVQVSYTTGNSGGNGAYSGSTDSTDCRAGLSPFVLLEPCEQSRSVAGEGHQLARTEAQHRAAWRRHTSSQD